MLQRGESAAVRTVLRTTLLLASCLGLVACAAPSGLTRQGRSPDALLGEASRLASLAPERLDAEFAAARANSERTGDPYDRFQVALVSFSSASRENDAYAVTLMEDYLASSPRGDSLGGLATVLLRAFEERIYQDARLQSARREIADRRAEVDALRAELAEERARAETRRRQLAGERARADELGRQLAEEQAGCKALRHQIEELKRIEEIINEREKRR